MLSPSDTAIVFLLALLLFGPEQLPKLARQLGEAMRHIQSTTQSFMLEMERAAQAADDRGAVRSPSTDATATVPDLPVPPTAFDPASPPDGAGRDAPAAALEEDSGEPSDQLADRP